MRNLTKIKLIVLLLCFASLGCLNDDGDGEIILKNIKGKVSSLVSCDTDNGAAYQVNLVDNEKLKFILTGSLPESLKKNGVEIMFDMQQSTEGFGACVSLYSSEVFYKLSNIKTKEL